MEELIVIMDVIQVHVEYLIKNRSCYIYVVVSLIFFSCSNSSSKNRHPSSEKLAQFEPLDYALDIQSDAYLSAEELVKDFNQENILHSFKSKQTDSLSIQIYDVQEIRIDNAGNLYVLKQQANTILVYSPVGEFEYSIGRGGNGPGEFSSMRTFEFNSDFSELYVLDRHEIDVFKINDGNRFEPSNTIIHRLNMSYDLCMLENKLFIQGFQYVKADSTSRKEGAFANIQTTKPVHEFDMNTGEIVNSFGQLYTSYSGSPVLDAMLSNTMMSCDEQAGTIVTVLKHFAYLFGYSVDGKLKWTSRIAKFKYSGIEEVNINSPNAGIRFGATNNQSYNHLFPLQNYKGGFSVIQFGNQFTSQSLEKLINSKNTVSDMKPHTVFINSSNGELFYSDSFKSRYMDANQNKAVLLTEEETNFNSFTLPKVIIYEID